MTFYEYLQATIQAAADAYGGLRKVILGTTGSKLLYPDAPGPDEEHVRDWRDTGQVWLGQLVPPILEKLGLALDGISAPNARIKFTVEGGYAVYLTNKTGAPSVKGTVIEASTGYDDAFEVSDPDSSHPIGVVYEDGVADGSSCLVVIGGRCQVKLAANLSGTRGYWVRTSTTQAGRVEMAAGPPGGGIPELDRHMDEMGHSLQSVAGTPAGSLCFIIMHFN